MLQTLVVASESQMCYRLGYEGAAQPCFRFCLVTTQDIAVKNSPAAYKAFSPENTIIKYIRRTVDINYDYLYYEFLIYGHLVLINLSFRQKSDLTVKFHHTYSVDMFCTMIKTELKQTKMTSYMLIGIYTLLLLNHFTICSSFTHSHTLTQTANNYITKD